jgi:hypothetical protein
VNDPSSTTSRESFSLVGQEPKMSVCCYSWGE